VEAAIAELVERGVELIDQHAAPGAQGKVAFLHPRAGHGVLIELQEAAVEAGRAATGEA